MDEKILIQSERYNVKKLFLSFVAIGAVISMLCTFFTFVSEMSDYGRYYDEHNEEYSTHQEQGYCYFWWDKDVCSYCEEFEEFPPKLIYMFTRTIDYNSFELTLCLIPLLALWLIGVLVYLWLRSYELTVTDKRIYGVVAWGKRVDLPVDSVSAISTIQLYKGVAVSTSSGRISFLAIKNADVIYKILNDLLIERQQKKVNAANTVNSQKTGDADEIKKFKELLDSGVITQEEFDAKKKQLLGL